MIATMRPFEQLESSIHKFGWLQGLRKLLKEKRFWLPVPATIRIV